MKLAIQHDFVRQPNGEEQSFSDRWKALAAEQGIEVRAVDVYDHNALALIRGCDGFMWRYGYNKRALDSAKRILPAIEQGLRIPVFPNTSTSWHFEDKVAQRYLLEAADIPSARTWVFWDRAAALAFSASATYPLVVKLTSGMRSGNVALFRTQAETRAWIERIFGGGVRDMAPAPAGIVAARSRVKESLKALIGRSLPQSPHHGYFYAQEFLPGNPGDTRITVIGNRAYGFTRLNRENDFRASGSGRLSWDTGKIDERAVRLSYDVAHKLGTQVLAVDVMQRGGTPVVTEVSYTYAAWILRDCPGHWVLDGDPYSSPLRWRSGQLRSEDAIFEDFVNSIRTGATPAKG